MLNDLPVAPVTGGSRGIGRGPVLPDRLDVLNHCRRHRGRRQHRGHRPRDMGARLRFTDALREEERGNGVRVSSIHPGRTRIRPR